jgi:hypothetical protein
MQSKTVVSTLRDVLKRSHRDLTSLLLSAAMLAPIVAAVVGWPVETPLDVPLLVHATLLVAVALVAFGLAKRNDAALVPRRSARWLAVVVVAVGFEATVHHRANVFYTERALIEGMAALFTLHLGVGLLRRRAMRRLDQCDAPATPRRWARGAEWRQRIRIRCLPATPGVRLSDGLVALVGWLVLAAWVLIAFTHRHPAGPMLLAAGAAESLALLALVPDALAGLGWLPSRSSGDGRDSDRADRLALVRDATHATPGRAHHLRRHS